MRDGMECGWTTWMIEGGNDEHGTDDSQSKMDPQAQMLHVRNMYPTVEVETAREILWLNVGWHFIIPTQMHLETCHTEYLGRDQNPK